MDGPSPTHRYGAHMAEPGAPQSLTQLRRYIAADYRAAGGAAQLLNPAILVPVLFRVSQLLWRRRLRPLAKLVEWALVMTVSSQLSPSAEVGPGLSLPHPVGIVLGSRTRLGCRVTLGQNVTLGSNFRRSKGGRVQPTLADGVRVSAGAVVAGPIVVGEDAVIGANAVVTADVPPGHLVRAPRPDIVPRQGAAAG